MENKFLFYGLLIYIYTHTLCICVVLNMYRLYRQKDNFLYHYIISTYKSSLILFIIQYRDVHQRYSIIIISEYKISFFFLHLFYMSVKYFLYLLYIFNTPIRYRIINISLLSDIKYLYKFLKKNERDKIYMFSLRQEVYRVVRCGNRPVRFGYQCRISITLLPSGVCDSALANNMK